MNPYDLYVCPHRKLICEALHCPHRKPHIGRYDTYGAEFCMVRGIHITCVLAEDEEITEDGNVKQGAAL